MDAVRPAGDPPAAALAGAHPDLDPLPAHFRPEPGEILCVMLLRNEALRLPAVIDWYRRLGVDRFLFIDNGSTDATHAIAASAPRAAVVMARGSYAAARSGIDWINALLDRHARGHWCVVVDADELLAYAGFEEAGLKALAGALDHEGAEALLTQLVDCYPEGSLATLQYQPGGPLPEAAPCFDAGPYARRASTRFPGVEVYGGPRQRLFYGDAGPADRWWRLRARLYYGVLQRVLPSRLHPALRVLRPQSPPNLAKVPFLKWRAGAALAGSTHYVAPMALSALSGALLHYKFLQDFHARAIDAVARRAYFDGSAEYRRYLRVLDRSSALAFHGPMTRRFTGSASLLEAGLINDPPFWQATRAALATAAARQGGSPRQGQEPG